MSNMLIKDTQVEVSSEEEGFKGAWYSAILLSNPTKSQRIKLRVRYLTLLNTDGSSSLIEKVDQDHIRPVPPENLYDGVVLEEGLIVDADYKDGWWIGLLIKKMEDSDKYLVYIDSPPDVIEFESKDLRPHLDWTGWKWKGPDFVELDKSIFSTGTMVEVSSTTEKGEVSWFPAMMIKEIKVNNEKKFIVKDCNKHLSCNCDESRANTSVDACRVRPKPPPSSNESYSLLECVEAFRGGSGWRQGYVRRIFSGKRYMVSVENSKVESVYELSDLRPLKVWEDGVWLDGTMMLEENDKDSTRKRKREETELSSDQSLNVVYDVLTAIDANETPAKDTLMVLPFVKKSPFWKKYETKKEYTILPQSPHFSPLVEAKEDFRECSAIGMMVNFYELLEEVKDLQLDVSPSKLSSLSSSFAELEKHGFNVAMPQSRIKKVVSLQEEVAKKEEKRKCIEMKLEAEKSTRQKFDEEIGEIEGKLQELKRREAVAKEKKEALDKRVVELKVSGEAIDQEMEHVELEFNTTVSAPW